MIFVVVALLWDENRGPLRRAEREGRAFATEHGWRFVADGSDVLLTRQAVKALVPVLSDVSRSIARER